MRSLSQDIAAVFGVVLVVVGLWMVYPPVSLIVCGCSIVAASFLWGLGDVSK